MEKPNSKWRHVYAVVRFDLPLDSEHPQDRVSVVKVFTSRDAAEQEVSGLMKINSDKGCEYAAYVTRFVSVN